MFFSLFSIIVLAILIFPPLSIAQPYQLLLENRKTEYKIVVPFVNISNDSTHV